MDIKALDKPVNDYVVVHIATTGLNDDDEIVEICAIKYQNNSPVEKFETFVKPKIKTTKNSEKYNQITSEILKNAPFIENVIDDFTTFVGENSIVGYNVQFVLKFLRTYRFNNLFLKDINYYDVFLNAKEIHKYTFPKLDLPTICNYYKIYYNNDTMSKCYAIGLLINSMLEN